MNSLLFYLFAVFPFDFFVQKAFVWQHNRKKPPKNRQSIVKQIFRSNIKNLFHISHANSSLYQPPSMKFPAESPKTINFVRPIFSTCKIQVIKNLFHISHANLSLYQPPSMKFPEQSSKTFNFVRPIKNSLEPRGKKCKHINCYLIWIRTPLGI